MGMSEGSRGDGSIGTVWILLGVALLAIVIALAAQADVTIPIDGVPAPSSSSSAQ